MVMVRVVVWQGAIVEHGTTVARRPIIVRHLIPRRSVTIRQSRAAVSAGGARVDLRRSTIDDRRRTARPRSAMIGIRQRANGIARGTIGSLVVAIIGHDAPIRGGQGPIRLLVRRANTIDGLVTHGLVRPVVARLVLIILAVVLGAIVDHARVVVVRQLPVGVGAR